MSTINVDTISDAAGSGKPNFPNGLTGDALETLSTSGDVGYRFGYNSGSSAFIHRDSATGHYLLQSDETGSSWKIQTDNGAGPLTRLEVDRYGNVLVGKTAESGNTAGHFFSSSGYARATRNGSMSILNRLTSDGPAIDFQKDGTGVGSISVTGSATAYNTSSDYRLKTDVQPMIGASVRVQELNPVNFEWIVNGSRVDGFLAHEAQAVVPEAVTGTQDAMKDEEYEVTPAVLDDEGNVTTEAVMGTRSVPDYQGIDQSKLVPLLTAALQEALAAITDLKARVAVLEEGE